MSTNELAKKIVSKLTKEAQEKPAAIDKQVDAVSTDLFGQPGPEEESKVTYNEDDLFRLHAEQDAEDRKASDIPDADPENSDSNPEGVSDLEEDLQQGDEAQMRSDDPYVGNSRGKPVS